VIQSDGISLESVPTKNLIACSVHPPDPVLNPITSLPLFSLRIADLEGRILYWGSRNTQDGCSEIVCLFVSDLTQ